MHGYWKRLYEDCSEPSDERNYGLLFPFCTIAEDACYVAMYGYLGLPTIEVSAKADSNALPVNVWAGFDSDITADEIAQLRRSMTKVVSSAIPARPM